ncbi:MAG TPA: SMC-Scp complex subunit ScpB, partial [Polyangiales bacterium]|nr:SMC-Scp complex subunit ScpB [Polyangiales bacterium]
EASMAHAPFEDASEDAASEDAPVEPISGAGEIDAVVASELEPEPEPEPEPGGSDGEQPESPSMAPASGAGLSRERLKTVLESLVFVSDHIVSAQQLARMVKAKLALVRELLGELSEDYRERGIDLVEVAGGFQFRSAASSAEYVREFIAQRPVRLTRAQLETLALIAYRQPITRPEIDEVRGVDSGSAVRVLLERELIKMLGRKDEPGRPLLYGSTPTFLEFFGMRSLKDLPTLREFTELNEENRALFKRKTGEEVGDAEAALAAAEEAARLDGEQATHISDEDLAVLAAQEDLAAAQEAGGAEPEPPAEVEALADADADALSDVDAPEEPMSDAESATEA